MLNYAKLAIPALLFYNLAEHRSNMQQHPPRTHHQLTSENEDRIAPHPTYVYSPHLTEK